MSAFRENFGFNPVSDAVLNGEQIEYELTPEMTAFFQAMKRTDKERSLPPVAGIITSADFQQNQTIPCGGRTREEGCLNFSVTVRGPSVFLLNDKKMGISPYFWLCLGGLLTLAIGSMAYFFYPFSKQKQSTSQDISQDILSLTPTHEPKKAAETHLIHVGKTVFDTRKQTLLIDTIEQKLTFQEAQLLQLFCEYKNELLERDFILKTVWGDDGVLITRSVDVFVSRLRKLLKADETVKIVNVHNRGYRFDTLI